MHSHLLGKKSWNVYNHDNIEKVKRDEAAALAKEDAEEQRMQELDAERRIQILRGEVPTPIIEDSPEEGRSIRNEDGSSGRDRKRRKRAGENDTDFEMRIANEQSRGSNRVKEIALRRDGNAPITDHAGHISLFAIPTSKQPFTAEKNADAEKEAARKKREYEDQYTMRFSNAAGLKQTLDKPWYSKTTPGREDALEVEPDIPGKDVWGNEDPRRKEREAKRIVQNDPLAMMKHGAAKVRQVERERKQWREEREKEMQELKLDAARRKKHKRRHEEGDLEHFRLDDDHRSKSSRHSRREDSEKSHRHKGSGRREHKEKARRHMQRDSHSASQRQND